MSATKPKPAKKPPAATGAAAAAQTEVPEIVVSDEFHAPISEKSTMSSGGNRRMLRFSLLIIGLIILAALFVWLTHEQPVE